MVICDRPIDTPVYSSASRRRRLSAWIVLAVALPVGQAAWLVALRGSQILHGDRLLVSGQILLALLLLAMACLLRTTPAGAVRLRRTTSERMILAVTVLLQAIALVALAPALSEDVVRYRLEGRMWLEGVSPYATSPADFFAGGGEADAVDRMVTFPASRTIYPPVAQALFAAGRFVEQSLVRPPEPVAATPSEKSPWRASVTALPLSQRAIVFRAMSAGFAAASAILLLVNLRRLRLSAWWAALLAWNPLLVIECGGMGHVDIAGVFFLLAAIALSQRRSFVLAAGLLALSIAVKPIALLAVPLLLVEAARSSGMQRSVLALLSLIGVSCALWLPALAIQDGYRGLIETSSRYSHHWEANGSIYEIIKLAFGEGDEGRAMVRAKEMSRLLAAVALLLGAAMLLRARARLPTGTYWLTLLLLLLAPVVYPWYLLWPLAMTPLLRGRGGLAMVIWSGTASLSYLAWHRPTWSPGAAASLAMYLPVYAMVFLELIALLRPPAPSAANASSAAKLTAPPGPGREWACP